LSFAHVKTSRDSKESPDTPLSDDVILAVLFKKSQMLKLSGAFWLFLSIAANIALIFFLIVHLTMAYQGFLWAPTHFEMC